VRASVTETAPRAPSADARAVGSVAGRDFGRLVHQLLEWVPFGEKAAASVRATAEALAPSFGLSPEAARRAGEHAARALALPVIDRARRAARVWRELPLAFTDEGRLIEGIVDLVFEEDGQLVVVDYKSDSITDDLALARADEHKEQLRLYGRGLVQALGRPVRERLILFTALGRTVAV
jgi:ATP-dependent helicase/nuclease subunit A